LTQRSIWKDKYGIGYQSSLTSPILTSSGLYLGDHPSINPQIQIYNAPKSKGTAANSYNYEYKNSTRLPSILLPIRITPKEIYPVLRLFFQKGSLQDSTVNTKKWFYPYSYADGGESCEIWGTLVRETATTGTSSSVRMTGAICNSFSINSATGRDYVNVRANLIGRDIEYDHDTSGDTFTLPTDAPLLWRNANTKIGNSYDSLESLDLRDFNLSCNSNPRPRFYNNEKVKHFNLQRITGTGSIIIPWENSSTNFTNSKVLCDNLNGSLFRLSTYWVDQYVTSGYSMSINLLCRYMSGLLAREDELSNAVGFVLTEDDSFTSSNNKISTWATDASDASKITFTFPANETLTGNVFPGDVLILTDASSGNNTEYEIERIISSTQLKLVNNHAAGTSANGTGVIIKRNAISIGLDDNVNRGIT